MHRYCRAELLRILRITPRQLVSWERAGLVTAADTYSFFDLLQIKKVRDLCAQKVRPGVIRQSLEAMQRQAAGMENPLLEASAYTEGHRIAFRHEGKLLEPWIEEFQRACDRLEIQSGHVGLDLSDLSYADAPGTQLLRHLVQGGVPITACSAFVAELLREPQTQP